MTKFVTHRGRKFRVVKKGWFRKGDIGESTRSHWINMGMALYRGVRIQSCHFRVARPVSPRKRKPVWVVPKIALQVAVPEKFDGPDLTDLNTVAARKPGSKRKGTRGRR